MIKLEEFKDKKLIKISLLTENFKEYFIDSKDIVDLYLGDLIEIKYGHKFDGYEVDAIGSYNFKLVLNNSYLKEHKDLDRALKLNNLTQLELFFKDDRINLDLPWDVSNDNDDLINPSMKVIKEKDTTTINIKDIDSPSELSRDEVIDKIKDISNRYSTIKGITLYGDYATDKVSDDSILIIGLDVDAEFLYEVKEFYKIKYDILTEIGKNVEAYIDCEVVKDKYLGSKGLVIK